MHMMPATDLTTCDREPIHTPGTIQPFGFMLTLSQDFAVTGASANVKQFLGKDLDALAHRPLDEIFTSETVHAVMGRLELLHGPDAVERIFALDIVGDGQLFDVAVHVSSLHIVIEAEPSVREDNVNSGELVRAMLGRVRDTQTFEQFTREVARQMKFLTGFDRVMVYRFEQDGSGEVIAEAAERHLESYLRHRYPASDIPQQARVLYRRNWLRIITDINAKPVPVVMAFTGRREPLDMSMSVLRAVSPVHIEYLHNMGVQASMSVTIMREDKLWGLFACHHYAPRHLSFERRTAAELFGQMFSWLLEDRERESDVAYEARARDLQSRMVSDMVPDMDSRGVFDNVAGGFQKIVECDGVGVWLDGHVTLRGRTPTQEQFSDLVRFLNHVSPGRVFAISDLGSVYKEGRDFVDSAAGVLAVPISRSPRDYLMFFRQEVSRTVTWAGDPAKPFVTGPLGDRLTPRKSFEAWQEVMRGQSTPWRDVDVRVAESLRITIFEVVLRLSDIAQKERKNSQERQELLIAELNHRVRNILSLIRGLVNQSRSTAKSVSDFADEIGGRVQALARAHDQLTQSNWGPGSLHLLLESEAGAYLGNKFDRVSLTGPAIELEPKAFSTLALVMHEMMTNSAKYGALCDSSGVVDVSWRLDPSDRLVITWHETGGPPVSPPTRRGFGTTIIERSIPFDLNGEAEINYDVLGVRARFVVPSAHVHQREALVARGGPHAIAASDEPVKLSGASLIVEDNLIIAMSAETILLDLGAGQVETAASVTEALRLLAEERPEFALLDLNLGNETSIPVALKLAAQGVPFIFASGYGDRAAVPAELSHVVMIQKPYTIDGVRAAIKRMKSQTLAHAKIG